MIVYFKINWNSVRQCKAHTTAHRTLKTEILAIFFPLFLFLSMKILVQARSRFGLAFILRYVYVLYLSQIQKNFFFFYDMMTTQLLIYFVLIILYSFRII